MASIAPISLGTGFSTQHRMSWCQVLDTVIGCNGHDPVQALSIREMTLRAAGIAAPAAAPTSAESGAGNVNGSVRYRVRWRENKTGHGTMSLASPELSITPSSKQITVTAPGSPPARATHWVLERTNDGGDVFYPVNRTAALPDGTAIATTTFVDNLADDTINQRTALRNRNSAPPAAMCFCFSHMNRVLGSGRRLHRVEVGVTNGNTAMTCTDNTFKADMVGEDVTFEADVDGKSYRVAAYVGVGQLTLADAYAGTTGTKYANIAGPGNLIRWSELREPEHWGSAEIGGLSNEWTLGEAGEPNMAGCSLGPQGVLWAKETQLYYHYYSNDPAPSPFGDARIVPVPVRRGAAGAMAMKFVAGKVYGMDALGVWCMAPGGDPVDISGPLKHDFKRNYLDPCSKNWHIGVDLLHRWLYFFVRVYDDAGTYPRLAYIWDLDRERWIGTKTFPYDVPVSLDLHDKQYAPRLGYYSGVSGSAPSVLWADNIGKSLGAPATAAPLNGTVTGGSATTLQCTGATWPTTGEKLKGVPVTKIAALNDAEETRIIEDNTATQLTVAAWTAYAVLGDTFRIGAIEAKYRTGRYDCGYPDRKKKFRRMTVKLKYKTACVDLYVKVYFDGKSVAMGDQGSFAEDGVNIVALKAPVALDATAWEHRFMVPLHNRVADDVQFEFYSSESGEPWDIIGPCVVEYDLDDSKIARKR